MARIFSFLTAAVACLSSAYGAQLQRISSFGTNPTNVQLWAYKPDRTQTSPPILVAMHYCTGSANAYFSGTPFRQLADQYGFVVLYPEAPDSGKCWDVHSDATLKHNSGGDSRGIASAVTWALTQYQGNATRVYGVGSSSGAMMANVLAGAYPDLFQGLSAWSGVPYACFAGPGMWNNQCANGQSSKTAQAWGDLVRNGYAGYTGPRPKVQLWHGSADNTLNYNNFGEAVKQWTNVLGFEVNAPTSTQTNTPSQGYTRRSWGSPVVLQANSLQGGQHNLNINGPEVIKFFELDKTY